MKVIAINSSPRTDGLSKTEMMLGHLVEGMVEAGAAVEIINLREKKIKSCTGCFTCWTKTPGQCVFKDDMTEDVLPKFIKADIAVYATPLYYHSMNSAMSRFKERTLPMVMPFLEVDDDGISYHPLRHVYPKAVWLSVCGFPDLSEFKAFSNFINQTKPHYEQIVAEIYRPSSEMMSFEIVKEKRAEIFKATQSAGRELIESKKVFKETLDIISQPFMDNVLFRKISNELWRTCTSEGATLKNFRIDKMVPRSESIDTFMIFFASGINAKHIQDRIVFLQFAFEGENEKDCFFKIESGEVTSKAGVAERPDIIIHTPFELWLDIMTKKVDGQQMFMDKKYTVEGDLELMVELLKPEED